MTEIRLQPLKQKEMSRCLVCHCEIKVNTNTEFSVKDNKYGNKIESRDGSYSTSKIDKRNIKVCQRFCVLATRFLDISCNTELLKTEKTLNLNNKNGWIPLTTNSKLEQIAACDQCFPMVNSFCEFVHLWTQLELQICSTSNQIAEIMKKVKTEAGNAVNQTGININKYHNEVELVDLRKHFILGVSRSQVKRPPYLKLEKFQFENQPTNEPNPAEKKVIVKVEQFDPNSGCDPEPLPESAVELKSTCKIEVSEIQPPLWESFTSELFPLSTDDISMEASSLVDEGNDDDYHEGDNTNFVEEFPLLGIYLFDY